MIITIMMMITTIMTMMQGEPDPHNHTSEEERQKAAARAPARVAEDCFYHDSGDNFDDDNDSHEKPASE